MNGSKKEVEKKKGSASGGVDMSNVKGNPIQFLEEEMSQAEEQFTDAPPLPATRIPRRNQLCACHSASTAIRHCSTARKLEGHVCFCWGAAERKLGKVGR